MRGGVWGGEFETEREGVRLRSGEFRLDHFWHQQDTRQHILSSSFIIHATSIRYEVIVGLSHCFKPIARVNKTGS